MNVQGYEGGWLSRVCISVVGALATQTLTCIFSNVWNEELSLGIIKSMLAQVRDPAFDCHFRLML